MKKKRRRPERILKDGLVVAIKCPVCNQTMDPKEFYGEYRAAYGSCVICRRKNGEALEAEREERKQRRRAGLTPIKERDRPVTVRLRFYILNRDGFACVYCGRRPPDVELVVDHIVPRSKGGKTIETNLVAACEECNDGKANTALRGQIVAA